MKIDFDDIFEHIIPMDQFQLNWRFTDEKYNKLPKQHLEQLKPLDKEASKFLWDFIANTNLHDDTPFKKDFLGQLTKLKFWTETKRKSKSGFTIVGYHLTNKCIYLGIPKTQ